MTNKITIIGAGRIGKAIHYLLDHETYEKCLWDIDASLLEQKISLQAAVEGAQVIFLGIPSWVLRQGVSDILPHIKERALFVALTKGLEPDTHQTADQVLQEVLGDKHDFALLSGPMMAEEIIKDIRAGGVVASSDKGNFKILQELFKDSKLYLEYSDNTRAVALAAVLKNVYSLGFGVVDGLGLSGNDKGVLFPNMFQEQMKLQELLGGDAQTSLGLAGVGDMICTGFSPFSRQRTTGEELIKTGKMSKQSESVNSLPSLLQLVGDNISDFPFLLAMKHIVIDGMPAEQEINKYFDSL